VAGVADDRVLYRNWPISDKQEVRVPAHPRGYQCVVAYVAFWLYLQLIDIIETVYRGASKGRGLVVAPKGESAESTLMAAWEKSDEIRNRIADYSTRYKY
jgi:hypothetical protein